jgi:hypothetical protein
MAKADRRDPVQDLGGDGVGRLIFHVVSLSHHVFG